jgi:hypothetical protein
MFEYTPLTQADSILLLGMLLILLLLVFAYAVEYVQYKTVRGEKRRRVSELLFVWLGLVGLFCAIRLSAVAAGVVWAAAILAYLFDGYVVDKTRE